MKKTISTLALFSLLILWSCNKFVDIPAVSKFHNKDPFKNTITKSQFFVIDTKEDQVIEGKKGSIFVLPKGCFLDENGHEIKGKVTIELTETFSLKDLLKSNLTTTSDGKALETGGMFFINAKHGDKQVAVNPRKPIYTQIPTANKQNGMLIYNGIRDSLGNTNWIAPKSLNNYLLIVEMKSLDFWPEGFVETVEANMPYKGRDKATAKFLDSLYFSFSGTTIDNIYEKYKGVNLDANMNEGNKLRTNSSSKKTGSLYQDYNANDYKAVLTQDTHGWDTIGHDNNALQHGEEINCMIDPAIIKTIKNGRFDKTFLATKEFEARLQALFQICRDDAIELYIDNIDKNMWFVDEMVCRLLEKEGDDADRKNEIATFRAFADQKLTNVKTNSIHAKALRKYYKKQLSKNRKKLAKVNLDLKNAIEKENEATEKMVEEYKEVLFEREKYRMETYNFELTDLGWKNVDKPATTRIAKNVKPSNNIPRPTPFQFEVGVKGIHTYQRVYTYFISNDINSMHRMDKNDSLFITIENHRNGMYIEDATPFRFMTIAYNGDKSYFATKQLISNKKEPKQRIDMMLNPITFKELAKQLAKFDYFSPENSISKDLEYQAKLFTQQKRMESLREERDFMVSLYYKIAPCCYIGK